MENLGNRIEFCRMDNDVEAAIVSESGGDVRCATDAIGGGGKLRVRGGRRSDLFTSAPHELFGGGYL